MRDLLDRASSGDRTALLGLDVYLHRLRAGIGAMAASLGGMDVLVFTGGVGGNSAEIRARATTRLDHLGVAVDPGRNQAPTNDADISAGQAGVRTLVVHAREDLEIARQVRAVLTN